MRCLPPALCYALKPELPALVAAESEHGAAAGVGHGLALCGQHPPVGVIVREKGVGIVHPAVDFGNVEFIGKMQRLTVNLSATDDKDFLGAGGYLKRPVEVGNCFDACGGV